LSGAALTIIGCASLANTQKGASKMTQFKSILTALAMSAASFSAAAIAAEGNATLTVNFTGIETQEGAVMGAVFDSEDAYNGKGAPVRLIMVKADKPELATQLAGLVPGKYAMKLMHDIDGDMKLSFNPFGMPTEPFAFSNNAVGNMGEAKWADAAFEVKAGENSHSIAIK
jgi:uncharacterized protein (DUF2141 family)